MVDGVGSGGSVERGRWTLRDFGGLVCVGLGWVELCTCYAGEHRGCVYHGAGFIIP